MNSTTTFKSPNTYKATDRLSEAYLKEDMFTDFEVGTCFVLLEDKMDDHYKRATVYEIIHMEENSLIFHVFGHNWSKCWRKPIGYLEAGRAKGFFKILSADDKRALFTRR